jgi:hypothetical protein
MFCIKTLDHFRFAIGPQNIDTSARPGIFPRHESCDFDPKLSISECVRSSLRGWGVVKSLKLIGSGPVGLVHTQKIEAQSEKPTWTKALEFTQFACPCGTDPRLLSGEQRTSHFKLVTSVDDP